MFQPQGVPSSSFIHSNPIARSQPFECVDSTMDPISGSNSGSNNQSLASKQRLRWTHELHERFVDAVAQLGGPDHEFLLLDNIRWEHNSCTLFPTSKRRVKKK